jgi:hypothetical protein
MPPSSNHFTANMPTAALAGLLAFAAVLLGIYLFLTWQMSGGRSPLDILQGGRALDERDKLEVLANLKARSSNPTLTVTQKTEVLADLSRETSAPALSDEQKVQILQALDQQ